MPSSGHYFILDPDGALTSILNHGCSPGLRFGPRLGHTKVMSDLDFSTLHFLMHRRLNALFPKAVVRMG